MANITDKITDVRNAARPNSARVTVARASGAATLSCNSLTGWPTASKVHFVTYQIDTNNDPVSGSQLDCYGIVSGATITSFTVVDGTDGGNSIGDVVEMLPTAAWGQDLAEALTVGHERTGVHKSGLPLTSPILTTPLIGDYTNATHTHASTAQGGTLQTSILSNPYKFLVYRAAAQSPANGVILYDTKVFDTGSNVDVVTNKGRFTAPIAGFYQFNVNSTQFVSAAPQDPTLTLWKNGTTALASAHTVNMYNGVSSGALCISIVVQLAATNYVEVLGSNLALDVSGADRNNFSGFLVSAT